MVKEKIIEVPVREIENPPPKREWGTKMAEYQGEIDEYRGKVFELLCVIDQGKEVNEWVSADKWPHIAKCIKKRDRGRLAIEILEIKPREKEAK